MYTIIGKNNPNYFELNGTKEGRVKKKKHNGCEFDTYLVKCIVLKRFSLTHITHDNENH